MTNKSGDKVAFIVEYEGGRAARFSMDKDRLLRRDHVARIIAGERQRDGEIPKGKILSVKRET